MAMAVLITAALTPTGSAAAASTGTGQNSAEEAATFDNIANLDELTDDHAKVFRLYWAVFLRAPDPGGALYWVEQHDQCLGLDAIASLFADSEEFATRYGRLGDEAFVELIYRNVLGRPGDSKGLSYWSEVLRRGALTKGGVVLNVSLSPEFTDRYPYPSDGVPSRRCQPTDGTSTDSTTLTASNGREGAAVAGRPLATVAGLTIMAPSAVIERADFHQASHPGALAMSAAEASPVRLTTMTSRGRGTNRQSAVDIVSEPGTVITSPVAGTVARAGGYQLYCKYTDGFVVINPDGRPDLEVKILHMQDVAVTAGERVEVGDRLAAHATKFPFRSQIDALTLEPSWPHVHIEVVDPSIPRRPSSGSC